MHAGSNIKVDIKSLSYLKEYTIFTLKSENRLNPIVIAAMNDRYCKTGRIQMGIQPYGNITLFFRKTEFQSRRDTLQFCLIDKTDEEDYTYEIRSEDSALINTDTQFSYLTTKGSTSMVFNFTKNPEPETKRLIIWVKGRITSAYMEKEKDSNIEIKKFDSLTIFSMTYEKKKENEEEESQESKEYLLYVQAKEGEYITIGSSVVGNSKGSKLSINNPEVFGFLKSDEEVCFPLPSNRDGSSSNHYYLSGEIFTNKARTYFKGSENEPKNIENGIILEHNLNPEYTDFCVKNVNNEVSVFSLQFLINKNSKTNFNQLMHPIQEKGRVYRHILWPGEIGVYRSMNPSENSKEINFNMKALKGFPNMLFDICTKYPDCLYNEEDIKKISDPHNSNRMTVFSYYLNDTNRFNPVNSSQPLIVVHCNGDFNKDYCEFETSYYTDMDRVILKQDESFSQYLLEGEKDLYTIDLNNIDGIKKVYLDLIVFSGDVVFELNSDLNKISNKYYLSNKIFYSITPNDLKDIKKVEFSVKALVNSFYIVYFQAPKNSEEILTDIIESGVSHIISIDSRETEGKYVQITNFKVNEERPFFVNFYSQNCKINVKRLDNDRESIGVTDNYAQNIIEPGTEYYKKNAYKYQIQAKNIEMSRTDKNLCMVYVSGLELSDHFSVYERGITISENVPQICNYYKENPRMFYTYPISDISKHAVIYFNLIEKTTFKIFISVGTNNIHQVEIYRNQDFIVSPKDFREFCLDDEVCNLNIGVEIVNKTEGVKPKKLEVVVSQIRGGPTYLEKNKFKNDVIIGQIKKRYYFDIGKDSSGEILIDFKRGLGHGYGRVVKKKAELNPKINPDWRGMYEFPTDSEFEGLYFDQLEKRMIISDSDTTECDEGCYVLLTIDFADDTDFYHDPDIDDNFQVLSHKVTILPKIKESGEGGLKDPIIRINMNEYIFGNVYPSKTEIYDFYQVVLPFESDYLIIDWQADTPSLYIRVGEEKPTTSQWHFKITNPVTRIPASEIIQKSPEKSDTLQGIPITFAVHTDKIDTIIGSTYAFKLFMPPMYKSEEYKERMAYELIHIRSDQKVQCDPIGSAGFFSCLFAVIFDNSDFNKTLIVYPKSREEFKKVSFMGEIVDSKEIEKNNIDYIIKNIPAPGEEISSFSGKNYMSVDRIDTSQCLFFIVTTTTPTTIEVLTSIINTDIYHRFYIKPGTAGVFAVNQKNEATIPLITSTSYLVNIVGVAGGGAFEWVDHNAGQFETHSIYGDGDRLTLTTVNQREGNMIYDLRVHQSELKWFEEKNTTFVFYITIYPRSKEYNFDQLKAGRSIEYSYYSGLKFPLDFYARINETQISVGFNIYDLKLKEKYEKLEFDGSIFKVYGKIIKSEDATKARRDPEERPSINGTVQGVFDGYFGNLMLSYDDIQKYHVQPEEEPTLYFSIDLDERVNNTLKIDGIALEIGISKDMYEKDFDYYANEHDYYNGKISFEKLAIMKRYRLRTDRRKSEMRIEFAANSEYVKWTVGETDTIPDNEKFFNSGKFVKANGKTIMYFTLGEEFFNSRKDLYLIVYTEIESYGKLDSKLGNYMFRYMYAKSRQDFFPYVVDDYRVECDIVNRYQKQKFRLTFPPIPNNYKTEYYIKAVYNSSLIEQEIKDTIVLSESDGKHIQIKEPKYDNNGNVTITFDAVGKSVVFVKILAKIEYESSIEYVSYPPVDVVSKYDDITEIQIRGYRFTSSGSNNMTYKLVFPSYKTLPEFVQISIKSSSKYNQIAILSDSDENCEEDRLGLAMRPHGTVNLFIHQSQIVSATKPMYLCVRCQKERRCQYDINIESGDVCKLDFNDQVNYYVNKGNRELIFRFNNPGLAEDNKYMNFWVRGRSIQRATLGLPLGEFKEYNYGYGKTFITKYNKNATYELLVKAEEGDYVSIGNLYIDNSVSKQTLRINDYEVMGMLNSDLPKICFPLERKDASLKNHSHYIKGIVFTQKSKSYFTQSGGQTTIGNEGKIMEEVTDTLANDAQFCIENPSSSELVFMISSYVPGYNKFLHIVGSPQIPGIIYPQKLAEKNILILQGMQPMFGAREVNYNMKSLTGHPDLRFDKCKTFPDCEYDDEKFASTEDPTHTNSMTVYSFYLNEEKAYTTISAFQPLGLIKCDDGFIESGSNKELCSFETTIFTNNDRLILKNEQSFSQYLLDGEKDLYTIDLTYEDESQIGKVLIDLIIFSGDVKIDMDSNIDVNVNSANKYFLANKMFYSITINQLYKKKIDFSVTAFKKSFYFIQYQVVKKNAKIVKKLESGTSYIESINIEQEQDEKEYIVQNPKVHLGLPFMINFYSQNCRFEIKDGNSKEITLNDNYAQEVKLNTSESYKKGEFSFKIKVLSDDGSAYKKKLCLLYMSGLELTNVLSAFDRSISVGEGIPQTYIYTLTFPIMSYTYHISDISRTIVIYFNLIDKAEYQVDISVGYYPAQSIKLSRNNQYFVYTDTLKEYCPVDEVCNLNVRIQLLNEKNDKKLETTIYQVRGAPIYLPKNIMKREILIGDNNKFYYIDIGKEEYGDISIDFKRGNGKVFAKIVNRTVDKTISNSDWRGFYTFPQALEESLYYDTYLKKVMILETDTEHCDNGCYVLINIVSSNDIDPTIEGERNLTIPYRFTITPKIVPKSVTPPVQILLNEFVIGNIQAEKGAIYDFYQIFLSYESDYVEIDWQADKPSLYINVGTEKPSLSTNPDFKITPKDKKIIRIVKDDILTIAKKRGLIDREEKSIRYLTLTLGVYTDKADTMFTSIYAFKVFMPPMGDVTEDDKKTRMALELIHIRSDQKVQCDPIGVEGFYSCLFAVIFDSSDQNSSLVVYPKTADDYENVAFIGELVDAEPIEKNDIQFIIDNMPNPRDVYNSLNGTRHIYIEKIDIKKCLYLMVITNEPKIIEVLTSTFTTGTIIKPNPSTPQLFAIPKDKKLNINFETTQDFLINIVDVSGSGYFYWEEEGEENQRKSSCSLDGYGDRITMTSYTSNEYYKLAHLVGKNTEFVWFGGNNTEFVFYITYYPRNSQYSFDQLKAGRSTEFNYREIKFPLNFFVPITDEQISVSLNFFDLFIKGETEISYEGPMFNIWSKIITLDEAYEARTDQSKRPAKEGTYDNGTFDGVFGTILLTKEDIKKYNIPKDKEPTLFFSIEPNENLANINITGVGVEISIYKEYMDADYKPYISEFDYHTGKLIYNEKEKHGLTVYKLRTDQYRPFILIEFAANSNFVTWTVGPFLEIEKNKNYIKNIDVKRANGRYLIQFELPNEILYGDKPLYFIIYLNTYDINNYLGNYVMKYMCANSVDNFVVFNIEKSGVIYTVGKEADKGFYALNITELPGTGNEYYVKAVYEDKMIEGETKDTIALSESPGKYWHYYDRKGDSTGSIIFSIPEPEKKVSYFKIMAKMNFEVTNEYLLYEPVIISGQKQREDPPVDQIIPDAELVEVKYQKNYQMGLGKYRGAKKLQKIKLTFEKPDDILNYINVEVKSNKRPILSFYTVDSTGKEERQQLAEEYKDKTTFLWVKKEQLDNNLVLYAAVEFETDGNEFEIRFIGYQYIQVEKTTFQHSYYVNSKNKEMEFRIKNDYVGTSKAYLSLYASCGKKINLKLSNCAGPQCQQHNFTNGAAIVIELPQNNYFDLLVTGEESDFITIGSKVSTESSGKTKLVPNSYPTSGLLIKGLLEKECYELPDDQNEYFISGLFYDKVADIILLQGSGAVYSNFTLTRSYISLNYKKGDNYKTICIGIPKDNEKYNVEKVPYSIQLNSKVPTNAPEQNGVILHQLSGLIYPRLLAKKNMMLFNLISTQSQLSTEVIYNTKTIYGAVKMYMYQCKNYPLCNITYDSLDKDENITKVNELNRLNIWKNLEKNRNSIIDTTQYIMIVKCDDIENSAYDSCIFETSIFGNNDTVSLIENEEFSQYILKGEHEEYVIDFANEKGIKKVLLDTSVTSGDMTFNIKTPYKESDITVHKYFLANKIFYSITLKPNTTVSELIVHLEAKSNSYYTIEYSLIRNDEELVNTLFTGNSYLVPITKNVMTEVSRKTIIMNYLGIFRDDAYIVNFYSLNCKFRVEKLGENGQPVEQHNTPGYYDQFIINASEGERFNTDNKFRISVTENDVSQYENSMCMLYVSGLDISKDEHKQKRHIMIGEGIPQKIIFTDTIKKIRYAYPIIDLSKSVTVDLKILNPGNYTMKVNINNKKEDEFHDSKSNTLLISSDEANRYCQKNEPCIVYIELSGLSTQSTNDLKPMAEMVVKQLNNNPYYIQKNTIKRDFVAGVTSVYMFTDLGENDEGYLTVDFTRSSGYVYGRIVPMNQEPEQNADWRQYKFPKQINESLYYDFYSKRLIFTQIETGNCKAGCYLLIHIKSSIQGDLKEEFNFYPFTISVNLVKSKDLETTSPKTYFEPEEVVIGTLSDENLMTEKKMYEYYQTVIPYNADKVEVDFQSDAGVLLIKVGNDRPTKDSFDFRLENKKYDTMFELDKSKIKPNEQGGIDNIPLTVGVYTESSDSIGGTKFAFRFHYSKGLNIIKIDQDQKALCKPVKDKNYNYYCLFMVIFAENDFFNNVLIYSKSQTLTTNTYMFADHIPNSIYDQNDVSQLEAKIPTENSQYNTKKSNNDYIYIPFSEFSTHLYVRVCSDSPDTIEFYSSFHTFETEISPDPSSAQLFSLSPSQQELKLNFFTSSALEASIVSIYGNSRISVSTDPTNDYNVRGRDDRLTLLIPQVSNPVITIKNVNYKPLSVSNDDDPEIENPGFAFYIEYKLRNRNVNFNEAILGKTTELAYPQNDFPILFYTKIDDLEKNINIFFTFHDLETEDKSKANRQIVDSELDIIAGVVRMKDVYSVKNDAAKRPDLYKPKLEMSVYNPSMKTGQISFLSSSLKESKIKIEEKPAIYFAIEKMDSNLIKYKKIGIELTVTEDDSNFIVTEKAYQYGKLFKSDSINSYKLKLDNTTGDMRIQFAANSRFVDFTISEIPAQKQNMTLSGLVTKRERGKVFVTFNKPNKPDRKPGFIYLNVFLNNAPSQMNTPSNYVFKYINAGHRNYFKEYPIKSSPKLQYQINDHKNGKMDVDVKFNRIDKVNINIVYSLRVVYSNKKDELKNTIALSESKEIVTRISNPSDDVLSMSLKNINSQYSNIQVIAQIKDGPITEFVAYGENDDVPPPPPPKPEKTSENTPESESDGTAIYVVVGISISLLIIVVVLVIVVITFNAKNKNLMAKVNDVSFVNPDKANDNSLLDNKNELE